MKNDSFVTHPNVFFPIGYFIIIRKLKFFLGTTKGNLKTRSYSNDRFASVHFYNNKRFFFLFLKAFPYNFFQASASFFGTTKGSFENSPIFK